MSKSLRNFYTLKEIIEKFSGYAARIGMANAGDTLDDANFTSDSCN